MKVTVSNSLTTTDTPKGLLNELTDRLTLENPLWLENKKMGRWNGETPKTLKFYEQDGNDLLLPRGFVNQLITLCEKHGIAPIIKDATRSLDPVEFEFHGTLRPYQKRALHDILAHRFGTLSSPTGSGKTCMALYCIAERKQPALIVVHTKELLNQWIARIETFLEIPRDEIGVIGQGKRTIGEKITVALVQSLYKCADEVSPHIGHLIVDECHRCPSRTFVEAVTAFDCKYMLGLSATPWRRDGLSKLIFFYLGDTVHEIKKDDLVKTGDVLRAEIIKRETDFRPWSDPSTEYSKMLCELCEDLERNRLIASDVAREAQNGGGICLVLSDRKSHCSALQGLLKVRYGIASEVLIGSKGKRDREGIVERLNAGKIKVLIATGQLIGEGFDEKGLSTLFLATPIRFDGRVLQYLGRVLRPGPDKTMAKVYDYVDIEVGVLKASAKARARVYDREMK